MMWPVAYCVCVCVCVCSCVCVCKICGCCVTGLHKVCRQWKGGGAERERGTYSAKSHNRGSEIGGKYLQSP
jgi:hypothetical protein